MSDDEKWVSRVAGLYTRQRIEEWSPEARRLMASALGGADSEEARAALRDIREFDDDLEVQKVIQNYLDD